MTGRSAEALKVIEAEKATAGLLDSCSPFVACHAHIHLGQYESAALKRIDGGAIDPKQPAGLLRTGH